MVGYGTQLAATPLKAWQFPVSNYGAKGNVKVITDATMLIASSLLNSPAQAQFTSADVGKSVLMNCTGGTLYTPQAGTITAVNSATQAVVSFTSVSATSGATICCYGTDDTAAIIAAQAAAVTYAQAHGYYAEILFDSVIYGVAAAPTIGTAIGGGNAQIPLPNIVDTGQKLVLVYTSSTKGYDQALMHWLQVTPQAAGAVLACMSVAGTNDGTYGPSSMVGGPFRGYGGGSLANFSNCMPVIDGVQLLVPYNTTIAGFDFYGMAEAVIMNSSCMSMAVVPAAPPYPNITNSGNISNTYVFGVRQPSEGNNDRSDILYFSTEGMCYGVMWSEHGSIDTIRCIYSIIGIEGYSGNAVSMAHAARIKYASVEGSGQGMGFQNGSGNLDQDTLDCETVTNQVYDPGNLLNASVGTRGGSNRNGGAGVRIYNLDQPPGPVNAPSAPPSSGNPWTNNYVKDVWISITISTGTITGLSYTGQNGVTKAQALPGSTTVIGFELPANSTYTPTFTGTIAHQVTCF
jgi:hypothetical protein